MRGISTIASFLVGLTRARARALRLPLFVAVTLSAIGLAACTTYRGIGEFEAYRAAFDQSYQTGNAILDIFAQKERSLYVRTYPPSALSYDPDLASYYVDTVDPPATAAFRRGLETVKAYNDVLYGLASGQTVEALSASLLGLSNSVTGARTEMSKLLAGGRLAGKETVKLIGTLDGRLAAAGKLVSFALKYKSRADFRRFAIEYHEEAQAILVALRQGSTEIFPVLTADSTDSIEGVDTAKITSYRQLLSDWVISLDATILAFKRLSLALNTSGQQLDTSIAALSRSATELELATSAARKHLAELAAH